MPDDNQQVIAPVPLDRNPPAPDAKSAKEQKLFANPDELRREVLKQAIHSGIVTAVKIAAACVILLFVVRVWHLGAPTSLRWLNADELQQIDHLLFSGALGGFITRYMGDALNVKIPSIRDDEDQ